MTKTAVIGGGAAGMMAGIFAAYHGDAVTIFEKNKKIGRKLYITGKGRCNLTNYCDVNTVIANIPTNGRFLYSALNAFSPADTIAFFTSKGLPLKTERGNRVFPASDRAGDVVDTLLKTARKAGCDIVNKTVSDLIIDDGKACGVIVDGRKEFFDRIILASGGKSYPMTGSTGDGYRFAAKAGHTIAPLKPSLVPLETVEAIHPDMDRLLLKNVAVTVYDTLKKNKKVYADFGEMQFMPYGTAGAVILSASSHLREMANGRYKLEIDLKPALTEEKLNARLLRELSAHHRESYEYVLHSLLPRQMIGMFVSMSAIDPDKKCSEITREERQSVIRLLKHFTLTIKQFRPIEEAIVTSGGVSVKEIDPKTMQSKLIKGLYFAGEVIDVDGYTGGFNLQAAFSTGVLAGGSG
ncbi:MAG: NAD(P)/FAD-dependent oxidoreductase [Clostridia bacterium]|nr:NAD(P)/FAD-dependent oxidoreductase [Clostridia bacterium]